MNIASIPAEEPFLDRLAEAWLRRCGDDPLAVARGLILLPTRRSARALAEAFLRARDGRPLLLPRIVAFGAMDEAPLALAGDLALPPAVPSMRRLAVLSRMILAMGDGAPHSADGAWRLAAELATLMDEAERAEIDLAARLPDAADPEFAAHWQRTVEFLRIVTRFWPDWLAEQGLMNPAARQVRLLDAQAEAWTANPPGHPVWAAGNSAAMPAVARLLAAIARLPLGEVVLPALDADAGADLEPTHPQAGLHRLLTGMGALAGEVRSFGPPSEGGRARLFARALTPAAGLGVWREPASFDLTGLWRLTPADQQEEAVAIAAILRGALETPGARAALVTPDRTLAVRVAAELARFGVVADDSAGEPLAETPAAVFLRLLATAVVEKLAPVPLLALLKHPLCAAGLDPLACRTAARALELAVLRGQRPMPAGAGGLRRALDRKGGAREARSLLARIEARMEQPLRLATAMSAPPAAMLRALLAAAEAMATTPDVAGADRLWGGEDGEALATLVGEALEALAVLPDQSPAVLPGLIDALLEGAVVRTRRALRGLDGTEHPRIFIWGLLEARLQTVERVVLGGLVEGVWPPATEPGPWLSRPMRVRVGLDSPEERVGQAAHDFVAGACAAPTAVLSCPKRRDGAPTVPARWLTRLDAFLQGQGKRLPEHPAAAWARAIDLPAGPPRPVAPPQPRPPVALRPRRLSVTEIETWLADPYAIYARHVLRLKQLDALDEVMDAADYGTLVHAGLHRFLAEAGVAWPVDADARLRSALRAALLAAEPRPALAGWWSPRLDRIAGWVAATETARRQAWPIVDLATEVNGRWRLDADGGAFELTGRADRLERGADGRLCVIDYKTGSVPTKKDMAQGTATQLALEAVMAATGAFGERFACAAARIPLLEARRRSRTRQGNRPRRPGPTRGAVPRHAAVVAAVDCKL